MSDIIKDGGPAFPHTSYEHNQVSAMHGTERAFVGMSLRDWFAGMTLQGNLANEHGMIRLADETGDRFPEELARRCYILADAMLAEREKIKQ